LALSSRIFSLTSCLLCLQAFLRSTVLYCYMRKVSTSDSGPSNLQKRLSEIEEENAILKRSVAKHEEDLRVLAEHSAMMECEASDASMARDRAETKLLKLSEEIERLRSETRSSEKTTAFSRWKTQDFWRTTRSSRRTISCSRRSNPTSLSS
jgi:chromosome segregation ATPase